MANDYFNVSGVPSTNASAVSSTIRAEYALIAAGFDKLPTLTGNGLKAICVNTGATALEAVAVTGTGSVVRATAPTLVTPVLGVATATSINSLTITTSTGTLTITNGKTVSVSNTLTLTATDGSTLAIGAGGTLGTGAYATINQYALLISPSFTTPSLGVATATSVAATGLITTASTTASFGFTTGKEVTQLTSKATGVTINSNAGMITTNNAALNAGVEVSFIVTNSVVLVTDVVVVSLRSGGTADTYLVGVHAVAAGSFTVMVSNLSVTNRSEALSINFAVIKAGQDVVV